MSYWQAQSQQPSVNTWGNAHMVVRRKEQQQWGWLTQGLLWNTAEKDAECSSFNLITPATLPWRHPYVHLTGEETNARKGEINCSRVTQVLSDPQRTFQRLPDSQLALFHHTHCLRWCQRSTEFPQYTPHSCSRGSQISYLRTQVQGRDGQGWPGMDHIMFRCPTGRLSWKTRKSYVCRGKPRKSSTSALLGWKTGTTV